MATITSMQNPTCWFYLTQLKYWARWNIWFATYCILHFLQTWLAVRCNRLILSLALMSISVICCLFYLYIIMTTALLQSATVYFLKCYCLLNFQLTAACSYRYWWTCNTQDVSWCIDTWKSLVLNFDHWLFLKVFFRSQTLTLQILIFVW